MVWGAFCAAGTVALGFPSCRMTSEEYIELLSDQLVPFLAQSRPLEYKFQQDNASVHNSRRTMQWFQRSNIALLAWPACSPDLNPIENVWGILVRMVYTEHRQFESVASLKIAIIDAWSRLSTEVLANLVNSMPDRVFEVIQKNGSVTHY